MSYFKIGLTTILRFLPLQKIDVILKGKAVEAKGDFHLLLAG